MSAPNREAEVAAIVEHPPTAPSLPLPPLPFVKPPAFPPMPPTGDVLTGAEVLDEGLELLERFVRAVETIADAALRFNEHARARASRDREGGA